MFYLLFFHSLDVFLSLIQFQFSECNKTKLIVKTPYPIKLIISLLANAIYYEVSGQTDFKEDLASDVALFHACEYLINELEVLTFTSHLPKVIQREEKILADGNNLRLLCQLPSPFRVVPRISRFSSLQNLSPGPNVCLWDILSI